MNFVRPLAITGLSILLTLSIISCKSSETSTPPDTGHAAGTAYVGSASCAGCHGQQHTDWTLHGHANGLKMVAGGTAPTWPYTAVPNPPPALTWNQVSYVLGGYMHGARFLDSQGFFYVGANEEYDLGTASFTGNASLTYPADRFPFVCASCHTTGFQSSSTDHQGGLVGIPGTWQEEGIACEQCHGQGNAHLEIPANIDSCQACHRADTRSTLPGQLIDVNTKASLCGGCHNHDSEQHRLSSRSNLIWAGAQYDELLNSGHRNLGCVNCHNPHKSSHNSLGGVTIDDNCTKCHAGKTHSHQARGTRCKDCHMPHAAFSAATTNVTAGALTFTIGDTRSHLMHIDRTKDRSEWIYSADGSAFANPYLTVDFACLECHNGGTAFTMTYSEAQANAANIH